ncbi:MAG: DsbA family protein [Flavisolibacter sp.]
MSKLKPAFNPGDHFLGPKNPFIILVEYGDYECSHCGIAHPYIKRLLKEMGDQITFAFRNFPLQEIHPHAYMAALAAEAASEQESFWEMHDLIFENQRRLGTHFLLDLAENLQLDIGKFRSDLESEKIKGKVEMDFESGIRSGVNGTPTFFLNGQPIQTYDETYESLKDAVLLEQELKAH